MSQYYLGVDPGWSSGAVAVVELGDQPRLLELKKLDALGGITGVCDYLCEVSTSNLFGALEEVHAMPKQGVTSSFKFGHSAGALEALLYALNIPFVKVRPQDWMKRMKCMTRGDKHVSTTRAREIFPTYKIPMWGADAVLLALYASSHFTGVVEV